MVLEYFNIHKYRKQKGEQGEEPAKTPVLNDEEQKFLERIASEGTPPPLPERPVVILDNGQEFKGKDAQIALMDSADKIPLPTSPPADSEGKELTAEKREKAAEEKKKRDFRSYLPAIPSFSKNKDKEKAAADLQAAAEAVKAGKEDEVKKEEEDLTAILDQLNLSAVNNRVFSFSKESQELLEKFKLVLKDIINGAPTAYHDLEKLLTDSEKQLNNMYGSLPPFMQSLVKSLPSKMTATLAPELLAAASEKPRVHADAAESSKAGEKKKRHKKSHIPSLKSLVSQQGAVATMLRSILNFLKLRFPAFVTGTNILLSLAVFILLFVFWYCHKRGRETRLDKERLAAEAESDMEMSASDLEDSTVLQQTAESSKSSPIDKALVKEKDDSTPPLIIHPGPEASDKPDATVVDMPSVLDLPEPASVPLPEQKDEEALKETPLEARK